MEKERKRGEKKGITVDRFLIEDETLKSKDKIREKLETKVYFSLLNKLSHDLISFSLLFYQHTGLLRLSQQTDVHLQPQHGTSMTVPFPHIPSKASTMSTVIIFVPSLSSDSLWRWTAGYTRGEPISLVCGSASGGVLGRPCPFRQVKISSTALGTEGGGGGGDIGL